MSIKYVDILTFYRHIVSLGQYERPQGAFLLSWNTSENPATSRQRGSNYQPVG